MGDFKRCLADCLVIREREGYFTYDAVQKHIRKQRATASMPVERKPLTKSQRKELYTRQNGICPRCGDPKKFTEMEDDHLWSLAHGGGNNIRNRRLICSFCNKQKGSNTLIKESKLGHGTVYEQLQKNNHAEQGDTSS